MMAGLLSGYSSEEGEGEEEEEEGGTTTETKEGEPRAGVACKHARAHSQ